MAESRYHLFFSGKIIQGKDAAHVRLEVGKIFSADQETLAKLFSGTPVRIKSNVDQDTAARYRLAFREAGALIDIQAVQEQRAAAADSLDTSSNPLPLTLLPPNTGTLIDCAPPVEPAVIPDTKQLTLAPAGADMDLSESMPLGTFDTSGLTLAAPNSGTLEDCQPSVKPAPLPDISELQLATPEQENQRTDETNQ